jgi:hypothetical protein
MLAELIGMILNVLFLSTPIAVWLIFVCVKKNMETSRMIHDELEWIREIVMKVAEIEEIEGGNEDDS